MHSAKAFKLKDLCDCKINVLLVDRKKVVELKLQCLRDNIKVINYRYEKIKKQLDEGFEKKDIEEYLKGN